MSVLKGFSNTNYDCKDCNTCCLELQVVIWHSNRNKTTMSSPSMGVLLQYLAMHCYRTRKGMAPRPEELSNGEMFAFCKLHIMNIKTVLHGNCLKVMS